MVKINPDPHEKGFQYSPTYHVTAIFDSDHQLPPVLDSLQRGEFDDASVEVYVGEEGLDRLDARGKRHGAIIRALHPLIMMLSDETAIKAQLEQVLKEGGYVVSIDVEGDATKKKRAIDLLRANGGQDVTYWGSLAVERHGDTPSPPP